MKKIYFLIAAAAMFLAVEANAQSLTELRNREQSNQHKIDVEVAAANESKAKLQGKVVKMTAKAGNNGKLFGSVTSKEVAAEISKQFAVKVDKRKISMDDIKTFGSYKIEVKLYTNIVAEMTVMVGE